MRLCDENVDSMMGDEGDKSGLKLRLFLSRRIVSPSRKYRALVDELPSEKESPESKESPQQQSKDSEDRVFHKAGEERAYC